MSEFSAKALRPGAFVTTGAIFLFPPPRVFCKSAPSRSDYSAQEQNLWVLKAYPPLFFFWGGFCKATLWQKNRSSEQDFIKEPVDERLLGAAVKHHHHPSLLPPPPPPPHVNLRACLSNHGLRISRNCCGVS